VLVWFLCFADPEVVVLEETYDNDYEKKSEAHERFKRNNELINKILDETMVNSTAPVGSMERVESLRRTVKMLEEALVNILFMDEKSFN